MIEDVRGKKLLILGGSILACDIVETAKEMGVQAFVANWDEDSPAKRIADKKLLISTTDVDGLSKACQEYNIDGIFTASDMSVSYVQKVCEIMNFRVTTSAEQLVMITNKKEAKQLCLKHGIPIPKEYKITVDFLQNDLDIIRYPVLIKPVDSSGQEGISICKNQDDLKIGYVKAIHSSTSKEIVVEDYLIGDYIVLCFTIQNGFVSLSAMADKPVVDENKSNNLVRLPAAYFMPSRYLELFKSDLLEKFINLIHDTGMTNGSFSAEAIVCNNSFYVFEMQTRLGGMKHHEFVKHENKIDILAMHIRYALGGQFDGWSIKDLDKAAFTNKYCMLHLILKPGKIKSIVGIEEIKKTPEIFKLYTIYAENDIIYLTGTLKQVFAKILIVAPTSERLAEVINKINNTVKVYDDTGNNQLVEGFSINDLPIS